MLYSMWIYEKMMYITLPLVEVSSSTTIYIAKEANFPDLKIDFFLKKGPVEQALARISDPTGMIASNRKESIM